MSTEIEAQEAFYNERWRGFKYADGMNLQRCVAILDSLSFLDLKNPQIADLGCGAGWMTAVLGQFGPTTGLELSGEAVATAKARYSHVAFEQIDLGNWTPSRETFDVVVSQEVLEHLEDQKSHLQAINTLLRPGGYLILTTPNAGVMLAMREEQRLVYTNQPIENWVTIPELERLLRSSGMRVLRQTTIALGFGDTGVQRILNSTKLNTLLARLGLRRLYDLLRMRSGLGLHTVVVAQKH